MKCVRTDKGVVKVDDAAAELLVKRGAGEYVPRHVWKKETRDPAK